MGLVVIVGTGTDVGKTWVTERLVSALVSQGTIAVGFKPVQSGGEDNSDATRLRAISSPGFPSDPLYSFADPIAPHVAARRIGRTIDLEAIVSHTRSLLERAGNVLLESAGGLFSPLTDEQSNADLAQRLVAASNAKTLLVARDRIGAIHDVSATIVAAASRGLRFDGLVVSRHAGALDYTMSELTRIWGNVIPFVGATDVPEWVSLATKHLGLISEHCDLP